MESRTCSHVMEAASVGRPVPAWRFRHGAAAGIGRAALLPVIAAIELAQLRPALFQEVCEANATEKLLKWSAHRNEPLGGSGHTKNVV